MNFVYMCICVCLSMCVDACVHGLMCVCKTFCDLFLCRMCMYARVLVGEHVVTCAFPGYEQEIRSWSGCMCAIARVHLTVGILNVLGCLCIFVFRLYTSVYAPCLSDLSTTD